MSSIDRTHRREFIGRTAAAAVAVSLPWKAARGATRATRADHEAWLEPMTAKHRCFFDFPAHKHGFPLLHIYNYIATYTSAYAETEGAINTVGSFYSVGPASSIPLAFNDAMWGKYALGDYTGLTDPRTGKASVRNMFNRPQPGDPILTLPGIPTISAAGIESLQKMGTQFLLCNNALMAWVTELAHAGKGSAETIERDLRANVLPGVVTVPAMVIAIEKAQQAGFSYNKQ